MLDLGFNEDLPQTGIFKLTCGQCLDKDIFDKIRLIVTCLISHYNIPVFNHSSLSILLLLSFENFYKTDSTLEKHGVRIFKSKCSCYRLIEKIVTAQPQPQPNSTSTRDGVDKVISWSTQPTHPPHITQWKTTSITI